MFFIELISEVCWCAEHSDQSLVQHFIYLLVCRSLWGAALVAMILLVSNWAACFLLYSHGTILSDCSCEWLQNFGGAVTHFSKLHPLRLICGPGSLSWHDARRKLITPKSWHHGILLTWQWLRLSSSGSTRMCSGISDEDFRKRLPLSYLSESKKYLTSGVVWWGGVHS